MGKKVKLDFTGVENFQKASEGEHIAKIISAEETVASTGSDMIKITFEVTSGEDKGSRVYENYVLLEASLWKLKALLNALGVKAEGKVVIDLDKLIGKICIIEVVHEEYNGTIRAKVADYKNLAKAKSASNDDDEDFEDEDDEEEEEKPTKSSKPSKKPAKKPVKDEDDDEEDDEDDDEEEEEKPAKKSSKSAKKVEKKPAKKDEDDEEEDFEDDDDDDDWDE